MLRLTLTLCLFLQCFAARAGMILDGVSDSLYTSHATLFPSVGKVGVNQGSGTLIAPNWVMTAAHVGKHDFYLGGNTYTAAEFIPHPQYIINNLGHGYDIALIRLETPVVGVAPARIYTGRNEFGAVLSMAGYGETGLGSVGIPTPGSKGTFRAGTNATDLIIDGSSAGGLLGAQDAILVTDFDEPVDRNTGDPFNTLGSAVPTSLEYQLAAGDSGGGAFIEVNREWYVAGIHSAVASQRDATGRPTDNDQLFGYGALSFMTRVSNYESFIASVTGVPEPSSMLLIASCAMGMAYASRRWRSAKSS